MWRKICGKQSTTGRLYWGCDNAGTNEPMICVAKRESKDSSVIKLGVGFSPCEALEFVEYVLSLPMEKYASSQMDRWAHSRKKYGALLESFYLKRKINEKR